MQTLFELPLDSLLLLFGDFLSLGNLSLHDDDVTDIDLELVGTLKSVLSTLAAMQLLLAFSTLS